MPRGNRRLPAREFFLDWYTTALEPGEIVTAILLPPVEAGNRRSIASSPASAGDFAIASVALAQEGGSRSASRSAAAARAPIRLDSRRCALAAASRIRVRIAEAAALLVEACRSGR